MANSNNHKEQVNQNGLCYDDLIKAGSYSDWCTTVLFYKALHMVDQYLAKYGLHPTNHYDRYNFIRMYLPNIRIEYKQLYEASIKSRYGTDYLSAADKGKAYHERVFKGDFTSFSQKMTKVLTAPGP
jgi:hypothetical protein